ncbi:hypothetical protein SAMN05444157_3443 [Frankineae bacterium MT45]|nr:hypothetical protein SAMN05444157_3443 [Frankineae bacterium MT45]
MTRALFAAIRRSVLLIAAGLGILALLLGSAGAASAAVAVPYTDPAVIGAIGLCNKAGQPVTGGNIHDRPFVWRAVSSVKAPDGYDVKGGAATLLAYQPRPNTTADQWNGDTLTATSTYSNIAYPMAEATGQDFTLADFLNEYKPQVNGLLQLRIYVAAPDRGTLNSQYPATNIVVKGNTWSVVNPVNVPCNKGDAHSSELDPQIPPLPGSTATTAAAHPTKGAAKTTAAGKTPGGAGVVATATATPSSAAASTTGAAKVVDAAAVHDSGSNAGLWIAGLAVVAALAGGGLWFYRRSRTPAA